LIIQINLAAKSSTHNFAHRHAKNFGSTWLSGWNISQGAFPLFQFHPSLSLVYTAHPACVDVSTVLLFLINFTASTAVAQTYLIKFRH